jgi:mRNA-degrading endonuclease toxin of MazEF toxin-antitoxin module
VSSPVFGRVAWATIPNSRGLAPKRRPVIVVSPTDENVATGIVRVVGVTTRSDLASSGEQTELMFDPAGSCRTGLRERCWAVST